MQEVGVNTRGDTEVHSAEPKSRNVPSRSKQATARRLLAARRFARLTAGCLEGQGRRKRRLEIEVERGEE